MNETNKLSAKERFKQLSIINCKNLQRLCVERGLLDPNDTFTDEEISELSNAELTSLHKSFHELLYSPPAR